MAVGEVIFAIDDDRAVDDLAQEQRRRTAAAVRDDQVGASSARRRSRRGPSGTARGNARRSGARGCRRSSDARPPAASGATRASRASRARASGSSKDSAPGSCTASRALRVSSRPSRPNWAGNASWMKRTFTAVLPVRPRQPKTLRRAAADRHPGRIARGPAADAASPSGRYAAGSASTARACRAMASVSRPSTRSPVCPGAMTSRCGSVSEARTTQPAAIASRSERATG